MAIDTKQAVSIALKHVAELFSEAGPSDLMLEEIDTTKDGRAWLVTVSFIREADRRLGLSALGVDFVKRQYKVVKVDKTAGGVLAIKMRSKVTPQDVE